MTSLNAGLAARAAGLIGMGLFAFAVVGGATDRLAGTKALWEAVVPRAMADNAWRTRALLAIRRGDQPVALAAARAGIDSGPIEPASPELLGSALLLANRPAEADRAFRVAGQMGWRRPATQTYWMQQALAKGDWRAATMRLDALLRQTPDLAGNSALLAPFENAPDGRAALGAKLAAGAPWGSAYAATFSALPAPQLAARAAVLRRLAAAGRPLGCAEVGPIIAALLAHNLPSEADAIWRGHCPGAGGGPIGDGSFAGVDLSRRDSAFSWWAPANSEVSTVVDERVAAGRPRVVIASSASFPRDVVTRMVYLPDGHWRLTWQALAGDGRASDRIDAVVDCRPDGGTPLVAVVDPRNGTAAADVAANAACPASWLTFRIRPGTGVVRFGNVRLDRLQ